VSLCELLPLSESVPLAACELSEHSLSCSDADSSARSPSASDSDAEPEPESVPASDSESEPESDTLEPRDQLLSDASEASDMSEAAVLFSSPAALGLHCVARGLSGGVSVRRRLQGMLVVCTSHHSCTPARFSCFLFFGNACRFRSIT